MPISTGRSIAVVLIFSLPAWSAQPSEKAVAAYQRAVSAIDHRGHDHDSRAVPDPCSSRNGANGTVLVQRLATQDVNGHNIRVDGALIHHWRAAMFIPNARPSDVVAILKDYDHHAQMYAPQVKFSKLLDKRGQRYHVVHETLVRSLITIGLKIESIVDWTGNDQSGFASHSSTTHVSEFEHAGTPRARERSPAEAKGWMWREDSWWDVIPEANGSCATYETIALTRDIPWGLRWLIRPMVERFPTETLTEMLEHTRAAVESRAGSQRIDYVSQISGAALPDRLRQVK